MRERGREGSGRCVTWSRGVHWPIELSVHTHSKLGAEGMQDAGLWAYATCAVGKVLISKGPVLGLMFCCCYLDIHSHFIFDLGFLSVV